MTMTRCTVPGCPRISTCKELCTTHYAQKNRGAELTQLEPLPLCSDPGCGEESQTSRIPLCPMHYNKHRHLVRTERERAKEDRALEEVRALCQKNGIDNRWMIDAECGRLTAQGKEPMDLWDAPPNTTASASACDICFDSCPVRLTCLRAAMAVDEKQGIWGGLPAPVRRISRPTLDKLLKRDNPYDTRNKASTYYRPKLKEWIKDQDGIGGAP